MARASSPLSQRLKALAVRAGLPVETGPAPSAAPPAAAEQPTGEFPAVAASDAPEDDRPTGEFPAADDSPAEESAPAVAHEPEAPSVPAPIWDQPSAAVPPPIRDVPAPPPIWTDAPPESQSPPAAPAAESASEPVEAAPAAPAGPTLPPPTLSKSEQLSEAMALPDEDDDASDVAGEQPTVAQVPVEEPPAVAYEPSELSEVDPPGDAAVERSAATDAPSESDADEPPADAEPTADEAPAAAELESQPDAPDAPTQPAKDRLSLTGRFAALKRRVAPRSDRPGEAAEAETWTAPGPTDLSPAPEPDDQAAPAISAATSPASTTPALPAEAAPHPLPDGEGHKPSFSERAALRRRVKTLRARRDTGLLELGAIVLDQRRFGDPTAGALLRRRTDELGDLDNEIAAIERALDQHASAAAVAALGAVRCVGCSSLVGPTDRYCAHCGTPRPVGGQEGAQPPADQTP